MAGHTLKLMIYTIVLRDGEKKDSNFKKLHQAIYESTEKEKAKLFDIYKDRFPDSNGNQTAPVRRPLADLHADSPFPNRLHQR